MTSLKLKIAHKTDAGYAEVLAASSKLRRKRKKLTQVSSSATSPVLASLPGEVESAPLVAPVVSAPLPLSPPRPLAQLHFQAAEAPVQGAPVQEVAAVRVAPLADKRLALLCREDLRPYALHGEYSRDVAVVANAKRILNRVTKEKLPLPPDALQILARPELRTLVNLSDSDFDLFASSLEAIPMILAPQLEPGTETVDQFCQRILIPPFSVSGVVKTQFEGICSLSVDEKSSITPTQVLHWIALVRAASELIRRGVRDVTFVALPAWELAQLGQLRARPPFHFSSFRPYRTRADLLYGGESALPEVHDLAAVESLVYSSYCVEAGCDFQNLTTLTLRHPTVLILPRFSGTFGDLIDGAWIRVGRDTIHEYIAGRGQERHRPALDWIHRDGQNADFSWVVLRQFTCVTTYDLIYVQPTGIVGPVPAVSTEPIGCSKHTIQPRWWAYWEIPSTSYYDDRLWGLLTEFIQDRHMAQYTLQAHWSLAKTEVLKMAPSCHRYFPVQLAEAIIQHARAQWVVDGQDMATGLTVMREQSASSAAQVNINLQSLDVTVPFPWLSLCATLVGLLGLVWYFGLILASRIPWITWNFLFHMTLRLCGVGLFGMAGYPMIRWVTLRLPANIHVDWMVVVIEELIKTTFGGTLVIVAVEAYLTRSRTPVLFHTLTSSGLLAYLFGVSEWWILPISLGIHIAWNLNMPLKMSLWSNFVQTYCRGLFILRPPVFFDASFVSRFSEREAWLSRQATAYVEFPKKRDQNMRMTGTFLQEAVHHAPPICVFLGFNVPFFCPDRTPQNLRFAIQERILAEPPLDPKLQERNWVSVAARYLNTFPLYVSKTWQELLPGWVEHFPNAKRRFYTHEVAKFRRQGWPRQLRTPLFVKSDEVLLGAGETLQFKPRVVCNVDAQVQVLCGPHIRDATVNLHEFWSVFSPAQYMVRGRRVHVTFGSGLSDAELDHWMSRTLLENTTIFVLVAGDDSIVAKDGRFFCADASSYDQSQSFGPLAFELDVLSRLGVPDAQLDLLRLMQRCPYVVTRSDTVLETVRIDRSKRPLRDTGGPDTTLGNSLIMGVAWLHALAGLPREFEERFLTLGLKMKIKETNLVGAHFLKGMWYLVLNEGHQQYCWAPLPSRVLKMGKSLVDPRSIFSTRAHKTTLLEATRLYAGAVSASYRHYSWVPLISEFMEAFPPTKPFDTFETVLMTQRNITQDVRVPLSTQVALHYNIDLNEILWLCDMLHKAGPFQFISSPACLLMARQDYA